MCANMATTITPPNKKKMVRFFNFSTSFVIYSLNCTSEKRKLGEKEKNVPHLCTLMRKDDSECRSFAHFTLYLNVSLVCSDNPFCDGKPKSVSANLSRSRFVCTIKTIKNARKMFRSDADACVSYRNCNNLSLFRYMLG